MHCCQLVVVPLQLEPCALECQALDLHAAHYSESLYYACPSDMKQQAW